MKFLTHLTQPQESPGVARAALEGATGEQLICAAVSMLAAGHADRIGVWLQSDYLESSNTVQLNIFQGITWDRETPAVPPVWSQLSPEWPLPLELLLEGKSVAQDFDSPQLGVTIGLLIDLGSALWVPIGKKGRLRGVLLAGRRGRNRVGIQPQVESVAAELGLALELEETRRIAANRLADITVVRETFGVTGNFLDMDAQLLSLTKCCIQATEHGATTRAACVMIGLAKTDSLRSPGARESKTHSDMQFRWKSGDPSWIHAIETEPLANVWRTATVEHRLADNAVNLHGGQHRIVAIPLMVGENLEGVFVAGYSANVNSYPILERLETYAAAATPLVARYRQEEKHHQHAASLQKQLETTNEMVVLVDALGGIAAMSRAAGELAGDARGANRRHQQVAWSPKTFAGLFSKGDQQSVGAWELPQPAPTPAVAHWSVAATEAELRNGVRVSIRSIPVGNGNIAALLEPQESSHRFSSSGTFPGDDLDLELHAVLEWMDEGVLLFDEHNRVRACNQRFEQMVGITPEESGQFTVLTALIARLEGQTADPAKFAERWRELARGFDNGGREEVHMTHPSPRVLERTTRPVRDAVGRQIGRLEMYRDLTAQRVFQSKLLQTEKLAALGQTLTGVAHELSNPLTSILGYAQRLRAGEDAAAQSAEARQILQEAERAAAIVRQVLSAARETPLEWRSVSLNQIVLRAVELQRFSLAAKNIHIELQLDPELPAVRGDAGKLHQVLINLAANARHALEQRGTGGTIRWTTKRLSDRRVLLELSDDGPGIPESIREKIFEAFFTTKPSSVGTGLGLAIVRSMVREHGGTVVVTSPPGGGATFSIELPTNQGTSVREERHSVARSFLEPTCWGGPGIFRSTMPASATAARLAPEARRVLVVEDEPTVARLIADVLEDEGFLVDVLLEGRAALERAASDTFDLMICDMKMPDVDGRTFYDTVMQNRNPLRGKFLFVTGDTIAAQTHQFLERHGLPYLAKPFRVEELIARVREVLGNAGQAASVKSGSANAIRNG